MTLPNQAAGLSEIGLEFAFTDDGSIPGAIDRTQDVITELLKSQMQESPGWNSATDVGYAGLPAGVPMMLGVVMKMTEQFTGIPVSEFIDQWMSNPIVANLSPVITNTFSKIFTLSANLQSLFDNLDFNDPDFDPVTAVADWVEAVLLPTGFIPDAETVAGIVSALSGIDLTQSGSVLNAIGDVQEAFAQSLLALLGKFPIIGTYMQSLASGLSGTIDAALQAIRTATANQQIISTPGGQSPWQTLIPGFSTFDLGAARDTDTTTVTATTARGGFITPGVAAELAGISASLKKTGTVTSVNFDLYKLATAGASAGTVTKLWSSADVASLITTGADPAMVQVDFPTDLGLVAGSTDVFLAVIRMVGSGTITAVGFASNQTAAPSGYYPTKFGFLRDPSTTAAPTSISTASMAALYSNVRPWLQLNRYAQAPGGGPVTPPPVLTQYYDGFNRNPSVNSVRLGNDWVSERNSSLFTWSPVSGFIAIREDRAVYGPNEGVNGGGFPEGRQGALWGHQAGSDSVELQFTTVQESRSYVQPTVAVISAAADWSNWLGAAVTSDKAEFYVGTSFTNFTVVKSVSVNLGAAAGGGITRRKLALSYNADENVFTLFYGDTPTSVILSWEDAGHQVLHGDGHRFAGMILSLISSGQAAGIDDFRLADTTAGDAPPAPPPPAQPQYDRFVNFQTIQDGPLNPPGWIPARSGAGASMPLASGGYMVDTNTGTSAAANYLTTRLTDGARIIWGIMGFRFGLTGNDDSRAAFVFTTTDFSYDPDANGFLGFNVGGDYGPCHVVFDNGGYLVQLLDTNAPGGPTPTLANHRYAGGALAAGTLHNVGLSLNIASNTLTVLGADGVSTPFTTGNFGSLPGNYAYCEIYDANPSANKAVQIAYCAVDSVIGGRTPPAPTGSIIAYTQKPVGVFSGGYVHAGVLDAQTQPAIGSFAGETQPSGTIIAATTPVTAALTGQVPMSGTIVAATQRAIAALSGGTGLSYSDDFNRADAANLGGNWTGRSNNLKIVSNVAVPDTLSAFCLDSYNFDFATDNHKVTAKIAAAPTGTELLLINIRSNNTDSQIYASCQNGGQWIIYSKASTYAGALTSPTLRAITGTNVSFTAADDVSFEVSGTGASAVFEIKKNGSSILTFPDTGSAIPSGATHRGWAVGYLATSAGHGIDSVTAADI